MLEKWTGTDADRRDMRNLKLTQAVRRNFGKPAMFGFASILLCTWEGIAVSLNISLLNGGTGGLFWNHCIAAIFFGFVYASMSELGSMIPTSGGQYYWVAMLAPRGCYRYLSYVTAYLSAIAWQTSIAGAAYVAGTLVQGLFVLNIETYEFQRWHGSLLTIVVLGISLLINTWFAKRLPIVQGLLVILHIAGILIFIPQWIMTPRRKGGSPLIEFYDGSGWSSDGLATLVGSIPIVAGLIGFDCSFHMTEEARDSSRAVPVTLLVAYSTNVILGVWVILSIIYTIGPLDTVLNNPASTGYLILDLFYSATRSRAGASFMGSVIIVCQLASCIAALAAASRQIWSFARNRGVPFSNFFAPASLTHNIPVNAVLFSLILPVIIALINIGSTEALGIIFSLYSSALVASYIITLSCFLLHRLRGRELPSTRYSLGKWAIPVNVIALVYLIPIFVFSFFPSAPKPTASSMNWASTLVGGIVLLVTVYYIAWGRKLYEPPNETMEQYKKRIENEHRDGVGEREEKGINMDSEIGKLSQD